ncbi:MAG: MarR family winged helix-turn-helix transcriptional regulator [Rhizobiaceae bacterium]
MAGSPEEMKAAEKAGPAEFDVANRVFFRLYQSSNLMHKVGTRFMAEFGATTQQWAVLGALARPAARVGTTVKELTEFLLLTRQNLTPVLDRLQDRQWVERVRDAEDGRMRRVRLTGEGQAVWNRMQAVIEDFYASALDDFDLEDRVLLYRLLDRLKISLSRL